MKHFIKKDEIEGYLIDSPVVEEVIATGRSVCRVCRERILKGKKAYNFLASFNDGGSYNAWTACNCFVCPDCAPKDIRLH